MADDKDSKVGRRIISPLVVQCHLAIGASVMASKVGRKQLALATGRASLLKAAPHGLSNGPGCKLNHALELNL